MGLFFGLLNAAFFSVPSLLGFQDFGNTLYQIKTVLLFLHLKVASSFLCIGVSAPFLLLSGPERYAEKIF